jgi:hypothetical protein
MCILFSTFYLLEKLILRGIALPLWEVGRRTLSCDYPAHLDSDICCPIPSGKNDFLTVAGFCLSAIATLEFSSQPIRLTHVLFPSWVVKEVTSISGEAGWDLRCRQRREECGIPIASDRFQPLKKSATDQNTEEVPTDQASPIGSTGLHKVTSSESCGPGLQVTQHSISPQLVPPCQPESVTPPGRPPARFAYEAPPSECHTGWWPSRSRRPPSKRNPDLHVASCKLVS